MTFFIILAYKNIFSIDLRYAHIQAKMPEFRRSVNLRWNFKLQLFGRETEALR